jgi:hypothetical protein
MATKTASKAQELKGLLEGTKGLTNYSSRDDYGRTCYDFTLTVRDEAGKYVSSDTVALVNLPKAWIEAKGTRYLVNTRPRGYHPTEEHVFYFENRTDAHLFAVQTLLARA